jgi:hypothetical protein
MDLLFVLFDDDPEIWAKHFEDNTETLLIRNSFVNDAMRIM